MVATRESDGGSGKGEETRWRLVLFTKREGGREGNTLKGTNGMQPTKEWRSGSLKGMRQGKSHKKCYHEVITRTATCNCLKVARES